jgi:hypothetical protein
VKGAAICGTNIGNIHLLQNRFEEAIDAYVDAVEMTFQDIGMKEIKALLTSLHTID